MRFVTVLLCLTLLSSAVPVMAGDVYMEPSAFIAESFGGTAPAPKTLAIAGDLKKRMSKIMGSYYTLPQATYWQQNGKTAWILEDIGKYKPITTGFVIGPDGKLERVKVLIYRESHGWEVRHDFFTNQFKGAGLKYGKKLNKRIDGISGATLSVNALKRLSALALLLDKEVRVQP